MDHEPHENQNDPHDGDAADRSETPPGNASPASRSGESGSAPSTPAAPASGISAPGISATAAPGSPNRSSVDRTLGILAWVVIVVFAIGMTILANISKPAPSAPEGEQPDLHQHLPAVSLQDELIGKFIVAMSQYGIASDDVWLDQAKSLERGNPAQQLAHVALIGEVQGPQQAAERLQSIRESGFVRLDRTTLTVNREPVPAADEIVSILQQLYEAHAAGESAQLTDVQRDRLADELGWYGKLALHSPGTADQQARAAFLAPLNRIPWALVGAGIWFLACGLIGFAALIVFVVLMVQRQLQHNFHVGSPYASIYAEAFVVWLLLFNGIRIVMEYIGIGQAGGGLLPTIVMQGLSLLALGWPVIRGVPWRVVREDVGLTFGRRPVFEPVAGVLTYCMAIPMLLVGIIAMYVLAAVQKQIFGEAPPPSHPVQDMLAGADWTTLLLVLFMGAVMAPILEEIMFRGLLYRNVRDMTRRWGIVLSMGFSAVLTSLIFAAIHPQGWVTIPALMALAIAFCIAREWRGTLVPCMIAHGLSNGVVLTLNFALFGQ